MSKKKGMAAMPSLFLYSCQELMSVSHGRNRFLYFFYAFLYRTQGNENNSMVLGMDLA
ncbi:hypothetical protein V3595_10375 [Bacillus sp. CFBP9009]